MKYTTEHIENYLLNNMSISEKNDFEKELLKNVELQNELNAQKLALEVIEYDGIKGDIESIINGANWINWFKKTFISLVGITALFLVALFIFDKKPKQSSLETSKLDTVSTVLDSTLFTDSSTTTNMVKRDFTYGKEENTSLFEQKNDDEIVSKKNDSINIKHKEKKQTHVSTNNFFEPQAYQIFEVDVNKPIKIEGKQGTIINIPANAICNEKGNQSNGLVTIKLQEFYQEIDLIKNKVPTVSNGFPIETGGAINIEVYQNNELLKLKKDSTYIIVFNSPKDDINPYSTFYGKREGKDSMVNWEVEDRGDEKVKLIFSNDYRTVNKRRVKNKKIVENILLPVNFQFYQYYQIVSYDNVCYGNQIKKDHLNQNQNDLKKVLDTLNTFVEKIDSGKKFSNLDLFEINLSIDKNHFIEKVIKSDKIENDLINKIVDYLNSLVGVLKLDLPEQECNKRIISLLFSPVKKQINFTNNNNFNNSQLNGSIKSNFLVARSFGFVNCDRFANVPQILISDLKIYSKLELFNSYLIFRKEKVAMNINEIYKNQYNTNNIPKNSDLIIILFTIKEEKLMICIKEIGKNRKIEITESDFEEYDEEQLKDKIKEFKKS